jgi:hypothetical protein
MRIGPACRKVTPVRDARGIEPTGGRWAAETAAAPWKNRESPISFFLVFRLLAVLFLSGFAAALWFGAPVALGRNVKPWEFVAAAVVVLGLLAWWRARRWRREREHIENMRDSALW